MRLALPLSCRVRRAGSAVPAENKPGNQVVEIAEGNWQKVVGNDHGYDNAERTNAFKSALSLRRKKILK